MLMIFGTSIPNDGVMFRNTLRVGVSVWFSVRLRVTGGLGDQANSGPTGGPRDSI